VNFDAAVMATQSTGEAQEWTWERVDEVYKANGIMGIVAEINAALAAVKASYNVVAEHNEKLTAQLAAEREKVKPMLDALKTARRNGNELEVMEVIDAAIAEAEKK